MKPTKADLAAAVGKTVPDIIAPNLRILFCGINPSVYSAVIGHHFARPGNRFWPTLHNGGFTPRLLKPSEDAELLTFGYGITNLVDRATVAAAELSADELAQLYILPNPSGLNAHYTPADLARVFGEFRQTIETATTDMPL